MVWGNSQFEGIYPKVSERLLPDNGAQIAENCWLTRRYPIPTPNNPMLTDRGQFGNSTSTIFKFDGVGSAARWFQWNDDVFVVRAPVTDDTLRRVIWSGDGAPKHTTTAIMQGGGFNSPGTPVARTLGVPAPGAAPTVVLGAVTNEDDEATAESHAWVYTFVTDLEEEGPPSSPSVVLTRKFNADGTIQPVTVTTATSLTGSTGANRKRIYRTATGATSSAYLLVAEIPISQAAYTDQTLTGSLGDALISTFWDPPPEDLDGLIALPNGVLAGFLNRDVHFSEPYQPHAWPTDYIQTLDDDIVGMGNFGTNLVVGTKGRPYIMSGADPSSVSVARLELNQACASKHGFAEIDQMGVVFASTEGLVLVGPGGSSMVSEQYFDKQTWQALSPEDMRAFYHDGSWVGYTHDGGMVAVNATMNGVVEIGHTDIQCHYRDPDDDTVYLLDNSRFLKAFGTHPVSSVAARGMRWRSRIHIGPLRTFSAAQVVADDYPVTFKIFGNDTEIYSKAVANRNPFRLPSMGLNSDWYYEVSGANAVRQVLVGNMSEMLGN